MNRSGLQADLPQLDQAELGWSVDERRLFIGNGDLANGAPVIGNTEILTEFSNVNILVNNTTELDLGNWVQQIGYSAILTDGTPAWSDIINNQGNTISVATATSRAFTMKYSIERGTAFRNGVLTVASGALPGTAAWSDDYVENQSTGVDLQVDQVTNIALMTVQYSCSHIAIGDDATLKYELSYFN